jgi:hypothetical protein
VPRSECFADGAPVAIIEREPSLQQDSRKRLWEIMPADIRRLEYAHREPPLGELRRISTPAALCHAPAGKLSTGNRYFWHVWVNTPIKQATSIVRPGSTMSRPADGGRDARRRA